MTKRKTTTVSELQSLLDGASRDDDPRILVTIGMQTFPVGARLIERQDETVIMLEIIET